VRRLTHHIVVDRVVVRGAAVNRIDSQELQSLVEASVARGLADATLPSGRTMRAEVRITSRSVASGAAGIASAVGAAVAQATGGPSRG